MKSSSELYLNNGDLTFTGMNLNFDEGAIGDFDNDGFLDVMNDGNFYRNNGNNSKAMIRPDQKSLRNLNKIAVHKWGIIAPDDFDTYTSNMLINQKTLMSENAKFA